MFDLRPVDGRIVFIDTEFTTLDKGRREVWEIGVIVRDPGQPDVEVEWQVRPDLTDASPDSLRIGRYYRRCRVFDQPVGTGLVITGPGFNELGPEEFAGENRRTTGEEIAADLALICDGAYLVGAVPSADELALDRFMPRYGQILTQHYRIRCVETLVLGYLHGRRAERAMLLADAESESDPVRVPAPPWSTSELTLAVGCTPRTAEQAHRALNDARWAANLWDAVHGVGG